MAARELKIGGFDFERSLLLSTLSAVIGLSNTNSHFGGILQEADQVSYRVVLLDVGFDRVNSLGEVETRLKDKTITSFERLTTLLVDTSPLHATNVHSENSGGLSVDHSKRRDILTNLGHTTEHGKLAHSHELVKSTHSTQNSLIFDLHMPCDTDRVGDDNLISENTVVGHMGVGHEEIVVSDGGDAFGIGSAVYGDVLAENIAVTDLGVSALSAVSQILRRDPYHGSWEEFVVFPDLSPLTHYTG